MLITCSSTADRGDERAAAAVLGRWLVPVLGTRYAFAVRVIARRTLREFWDKHPDAAEPLRAWFREAQQARWVGPADIKQRYASASFLARDRVVFNVKGNSYRLIVAVKYSSQIVFIKFFGTHAEYDRIDADKV